MKILGKLTGVMALLFVSTTLLSQACDCITTGNCPVDIEDNGTFYGTLDVTVNGPNDLGACPLTQVCFSITHTWVGDLSVALTSPGGDNYLVMADLDNGFGGCGNEEDNVDVCIETGTGNPLTNNTEYMCNPGPCVSGTCCLTGTWTMPCGGVSDPVSGAVQAPNCDLNDFNTPGSPANGTWTLTVNDICSNDIGQLNNFSLEFSCGTSVCIFCEAEGGSLNADDVSSCFGDPSLNLSLPPVYTGGEIEPPPGDYSYHYVLSQNGTIMSVNPTPDLTTQPPGVYQVCGLSFLTIAIGEVQTLIGMDLATAQDLMQSSTAPFCGDFSNDCITVTIGNFIPPTVLDTFACLGECIYLEDSNGNEVEVCSSGDVILESYLGCDSVVTVILIPILIESVIADTILCEGECMEVNNVVYCPPGPFIITLESVFGCDSIVTYFVTVDNTQAIIMPDPVPVLDCNNPTVVLDGSASLPLTARFTWIGPGSFLSSDPVISVTMPGDYTLIVENTAVSPPCSSTAEVTVTANTTVPDLEVMGPAPALCEGESFDLSDLEVIDLNNSSAAITFHSATPATAANELSSVLVTPLTTTTYYILGTTTGGCTDETSVEIVVNPIPVADFEVGSPICLTETATVVYTGNAGPGADYNWNFGGGTATPGTGAGPHSVTWPIGGIQTITLTVTDNDCTSATFSQTVEVSLPLPQPVVNCNPETNSIEFIWYSVPGASGYNITPAIGPPGTMTSDTSYLISGLNAGEPASIFIEAISGNACANSIVQISCTAQDCPQVTITIDPVDDICLDGTQSVITLSATQTGGDGSGVFTFTGPGVNPISGTFNPDNANTGPNNILVTYEEGTCAYNSSIVINVFPQPSAEFSATTSICSDEPAIATYLGSAGAGAIFTWNFDGGIATPGTGTGPHEVLWQDAGQYTIDLTVEENGCLSEPFAQDVLVDVPLAQPVITCNSSTSSIEFSWNDIPGATGYTVNVLNGNGGVMTSNTSMLFDNLQPNTDITIEVVANSTGACGPSSAEATCTANNCESVTIAIEPVENICLDASVQPFDLVPTIIGGMGNGQLTWSGTGIINSNTGTFDPQQGVFGENIVTALYVEGNCTYTEDFSIHLFDLPVASFTTNAPVCEGDEMTVTYPGPLLPGLMFEWDFGGGIAVPGTGPGPHQVTWPGSGTHNISLLVQNANGCISEPFEAGVQVEQPFTAPPVSCSSTTSSVQFTWPTVTGATDYQVEVTSGQTGVFTPPNSFLLDGLSPNEEVNIELTIVGNGTCPPVVVQQSCVAIDCPPTDLIIAPQNGSACISSSNPVDFELTANVPGPTTVTWSGNGITDTEEGLFDPSTAGIGQHIITVVVENGNCSYSNSTTIEVIGEPLADFTATPVICESDVASLVYLGNASVDAHYSWDLDGGTLDSNQLTVSWDAPGTYNLSLQVEQDGCVSQPFTQTVEVTPELAEPLISCDATTDAVEFTWADVPGATDYQVTILSGPVGTYTPPGTYLVEGLMPGDEVTIEVTVNGNTVCDAPTVTFSCTANDCPDVSLFLTPPGPVCESNATAPFPLEATVSGGSGNGSGTWSGPGVVNGGFDASIAGEGLHTLIFTYEENANCTYTESISVEVVPPPVADAGAGGTLTCEPGGMDVQLGGNANPSGNNISYLWQADFGAFPGDSTILHPVVALPGTYTLTVTDTDLGCSSTDVVVVEASQEIPVPDLTLLPISCYGNNDGAIIINSVSGGQEPYLFSLNGSPFGSNSSFTQLPPAIYEVQILDANGCENLLTFDIRQPQELDVSLVLSIEGNNVITLGDEITMTGIVTLPEDSLDIIRWSPPELVSCDSCLQVIAQPVQQTTFTLTVESNGCEDSESVTVFVAKDWQVFVPNAFSPNGDNINDRFRIFVNAEQVTEVKSFLIFNRWGETVFQFYGFDPNDPNTGWDGTFRGKPLNPAVFVWFAEVEFIDGSTRLFEGDVTLIR